MGVLWLWWWSLLIPSVGRDCCHIDYGVGIASNLPRFGKFDYLPNWSLLNVVDTECFKSDVQVRQVVPAYSSLHAPHVPLYFVVNSQVSSNFLGNRLVD